MGTPRKELAWVVGIQIEKRHSPGEYHSECCRTFGRTFLNSLIAKGFHLFDGESKWLSKGITYGPFRPNSMGYPFPEEARVRQDFEMIAAMGGNSLRVYSVPHEDFASLAYENGHRLLIDIPWPKHLDIYRNRKRQKTCLEMVKEGMERIKDWPNVMGVILGNEVPSDLVRWAGVRRVESFLYKLYRTAHDIAPQIPIGYANFREPNLFAPVF